MRSFIIDYGNKIINNVCIVFGRLLWFFILVDLGGGVYFWRLVIIEVRRLFFLFGRLCREFWISEEVRIIS